MKDLKSIIKSLTAKEVKFITDYYKNNEDKKRLVLFKGILSGKFDTDEKAAIKIYDTKGSAYSHLKTRLKDDLLNLLLFTSKEIKHQSAVLQAELDVDRMLMQAKLLHRRNVTDLAIKLLKNAYKLCIKYELIKEKVIVTYWYGIIAGNKLGVEVFEQINNKLEQDLETLHNYLNAYKIRHGLTIFNKFSKENKEEYYKLAYQSYLKIKKIYKTSNSNNIGYYYYITAIGHFTLIKKYNKVYELAKKLQILVTNNIEVNSIMKEVNAFLQIFNATIHMEKYNESTKNAINAYKLISKSRLKNSVNELIVLEYAFLSNIRENDLSKLLVHLNNGLNHPQVRSSIKMEEKWKFFKVAYHFKINEFHKSLESLNQINTLLQDKSGWLFTFKLLEIMCYIEQEEFDMVHYRIETFRKLLSKKNNENIERIKTIHQVLKSLLKYGFNFKQVAKTEKENIELLKYGEDTFYWDPLGFEIIRFDEWFISKL